MKKLLIIGIAVLIPIFIQGCSEESVDGTSNRDIVIRYAKNTEENSENAEIYRQLAEIIVNRHSGNNKIVDYATENKPDTEKEKEKAVEGSNEIENFTPGKKKEFANTDNVQCDFALESGLYVAGRDIPTGQYRIGFSTTNHGMYCLELHGEQQIQPGSMNEDASIYWYNCEFTEDLLIKVDKKAYFMVIVPGEQDSDYDMSNEYYEDMNEVKLLWLAAADKKPEISISDAKVIKDLGQNTYVMKYSGGLVVAEFADKSKINSDEITFKGRVISSVKVGQKSLAKIKVTN